jgi:hypothetical protein
MHHIGATTYFSYPGEESEKLEICYAENRWIQEQVAKAKAPPKNKPSGFSSLVRAIDALHFAVAAGTNTPKSERLSLPNTGDDLTEKAFAAGFTSQREYERAVALGYETRAEYAPALYGAQIAARRKARAAINDGTARF